MPGSEHSAANVLHTFERIWHDLRGTKPWPIWCQIDPITLPRQILPHLIVVDVYEDRDFRYRLTGTRVDEYMGFTLQGYRLSEAPFNGRQDISQEFLAALKSEGPRYSNRALGTKVARYGHTERVIAPLSKRGDGADMLLGAVVYSQPRDVSSVQFYPRGQ